MSREVPMDRPLSEEDRAYLLSRGYESRVEQIDAAYPADADTDRTEETGTGSGTPETGTGTGEEDPGYEEWSKDDLKAELEERGLAKSGTNAEMAARLRAHDAQA